jgi:hypothetical protein
MATVNPYKRRQEIYNCILGKDASEIINDTNNNSIKDNLIRKINTEFGSLSRSSSEDSFEILGDYGEPIKPTATQTLPSTSTSGIPPPPPMPSLLSATNPPANKMALLGALGTFNKDALKKVSLPSPVTKELEVKTADISNSTANRNEVVDKIKNPDALSIAQQAMNVKLKSRTTPPKPTSESTEQTELQRVLAKLREKESPA